MFINRREFIGTALRGSALVSMGLTAPTFLCRSARAAVAGRDERVLVVVQLSGGNDGLNTVVPYADEGYARNRQVLRVPGDQVLRVDDYCGLHPSLEGFAKLLEAGQLGVVHGVGYPNPNRSHFRSMDIWHTASVAEQLPGDGWLGRAVSTTSLRREGLLPAIHVGSRLPLALAGRDVEVPSLDSLDDYRLRPGAARSDLMAVAAAVRDDATLQFLQRTGLEAYVSSGRIEEMARRYDTPVRYAATQLARKLKLVAQLIDAGLGLRIYYVSLDGFDTHANQLPAHANLLRELGDAVRCFMEDMAHHGHSDRVLLMTFSEFGRRVKENGSRGTDHGAAAPLFLAGGRVRAGQVGKYPSLSDLEDGDLKFHTDFRSVYGTVLEDWLGCPSGEVLGGAYAKLDLLAHA